MGPWGPQGPRKRRTREHVIADLSVNHVERFVLRCGWTVERSRHDYGIDLSMDTFNIAGEVESGRVLFQLKATDKLRVRSKGSTVALRLDKRDLDAWQFEIVPVILILYDAQEDQAYWLYVQEYLAGLRRRARGRLPATTTAYVPRTQVVSEAAVRQFARFRDAFVERLRRFKLHEG